MKTKFIKECDTCWGRGSVLISSAYEHPSHSESDICEDCKGEGTYFDKELINECIDDVDDMIEGMINRIRITSDTLKDLSRGMFYELLPKYKHRLQIQARALARLEMYCANLKNYVK
jgi:RecJ-like exonuclease